MSHPSPLPRRRSRPSGALMLTLLALLLASSQSEAQSSSPSELVFGIRISAGGRYDNVRKCVASPTGTKGGPAADVSFFTEVGLRPNLSLTFNLPVFRPVLFALAFKMLQFEPDVMLTFRRRATDGTDVIFGPTLGLSLHYGPDYTSESSGPGRGPSFFALGPMLGGYLALDFKRQSSFNFQLGIHPYVTPLFAVNDPASHRGVVVGGMLEGQLRFAKGR
jgi:hypothetical protein